MRQAMIIGASFGEVLSAYPYFADDQEEAPATMRSPGTEAQSLGDGAQLAAQSDA